MGWQDDVWGVRKQKSYAFVPVTHDRYWAVGRVDEFEKGYTPMPAVGLFETEEAARKVADEMNREFGITKKRALLIVATTMRK